MPKNSIYNIVFIILIACTLCTCSQENSELAGKQIAVNANDIWPADDSPAAVSINGNLWDDMQDYLALPDYSNRPEVQQQIRWFQHHQGYINRVIARAAPYIYYIYQQTQERNLPAELALMPINESSYNPFRYSEVGANGLWQFMPGTASGKGLKIDWWYDGRRDIAASTNAAFDYLAYLNDFFSGDWVLAIAAYDCGEGTVQAAIEYNKRHNRPTDFWSLHLPKETESYVPKLLALSAIIRDPYRYGIRLLPINDAPYLKEVNVGSQIDLAQAAKLAGISVDTMHKLNPGFRRWATDPDGPYTLLLPADKAAGFMQRLNALPKNQRVTWQEHIVQPGDTLSTIAYKYKTETRILKQVNQLSGNIIRPKQRLLIPVAFHGSLKSPIVKQHATIAEENLPGPNRVIYVVENGDTLWTMAEKYGIKVNQLRFWNNLPSNTTLSPNQKLLIWVPSHTRPSYTHTYIYKVEPGDSLSVIAHRFNSSSKQIRKANHLKNNTIRAGQVLTVPGGIHHAQKQHNTQPHITLPPHTRYLIHTVKSGDNLQKIAHEFHTTSSNLEKWNNLENTKYIHPGQKVYIYYHDKSA